ncbi:hypothetical protein P8452_13343 [Trifolium repens]|nr:hypothetical protein P8452_13343 [Trifolium repens]
MDSPEPSQSLNPGAESPQVEESPFLRFANTLSPIKPVKASHHETHGFLRLNSPPPVFESPRISDHHRRQTQYLEMPHLSSGEISQSDDFKKLTCQQSLSENDPNSPQQSVEDYLADPIPGDDQLLITSRTLLQCAGNDQQHPQLMPDQLMVSTSQVNLENIPQDGSEASLKYHGGFRRRCLQFDEAASIVLGSNNKSHVKMNATSSNVTVAGSKPLGIGLHLNSIVNAMPISGVKRLSDGLQGGIQSKPYISLHKVESVTRSSSVPSRNESHQTHASVVAADSFISESPIMKESIDLYPANKKRVSSPAVVENTEESNRRSTSKKTKKTSADDDASGPKSCNCRKSKCLKLYCDCFGAGLFCGDDCACESCGNRIEFQETVVETKHHIESRNPQAFAPKIVLCAADVLQINMEDVNMITTPASARHKRGCNCKRSKCTKKYCECFQASVGCSSGCRCDGCLNAFGKREDFVAMEHASSKDTGLAHSESNNSQKNASTTGPSSKDNEWLDLPPPYQLSNRSGILRQLSGGSIRWRGSSPIFTPNASKDDESDGKLFDIVEDETPIKSVKANSPIQKRVSPPQNHLLGIGSSSSSGGLKSGRKFILQSVPSFPPLTPCADSKAIRAANEDSGNNADPKS